MKKHKITYEQMVQSLAKPGSDILKELTPLDCHLLHMVVGIAGEAGELLDAVKKAVIYRKKIDRKNIKEEAGDLIFYATGLVEGIGSSIEECKKLNMKKLSKRYKGFKYSNRKAVLRRDKK